jgi:hypothetical protein
METVLVETEPGRKRLVVGPGRAGSGFRVKLCARADTTGKNT